MSLTPAVDSFLKCLRSSGLIEGKRIELLLLELRGEDVNIGDARQLANGLVRKKIITSWQAEKLLRGKRRGFILGKYRLLSLLGRGGAGSVYLAEHILMRRLCALKVLPATSLAEPAHLQRFHEEARALASLEHTNVVRAYDIDQGLDGNIEIHFFVMEYVEGETLQQRTDRDGPLGIVDAADAIRQAAAGLAHAHRAQIVHRDIKPANLLLDKSGIVKILDLGMATLLRDGAPRTDLKASSFGTADFIAPEQALAATNVDARSDIYSLGCTLYFLLAGHPPFPRGTLAERLVSHQFETPIPITAKRSDVPAELAAVLERMMAKIPDNRIQSAEEVEERLRDFLSRHADGAWLQKNPAVLRRASGTRENIDAESYKRTPAAAIPEPAKPREKNSSAPVITSSPVANAPSPTSPTATAGNASRQAPNAIPPVVDEEEGALSRLTRSFVEPPKHRTKFELVARLKGTWNDRRGRELLIAGGMLLIVLGVVLWNLTHP